MTLLEALETECANLVPKVKFILDSVEQANAVRLDTIPSNEFPVCIVTPFNVNDYSREHGRIVSEAELNIIFVTRETSNPTVDKSTDEAIEKYVSPMMAIARQFVNRLDKNDELVEEDGVTNLTMRPVHEAMFDSHLYGCWAVFTIKFSEGLTTCQGIDE